MSETLSVFAPRQQKSAHYELVLQKISALAQDESDQISVLSTICCELHHSFEYYHWTGFYRFTPSGLLKVGPYQGGHGCLVISLQRGVCGKAAREGKTQRIDDVNQIPHHIACSSSTQSEIVVPIFAKNSELVAVLDIDSNDKAAFDEIDQMYLERLAGWLSGFYP